MNQLFKKIVFTAQLALIALCSISIASAQAGAVDPAFNPGLLQQGASVNRIVAQPDGKILIAGSFPAAGKIEVGGIARLNADGTLDTTFRSPGVSTFNGQGIGRIFAVQVQADGKILIGGEFTNVGAASRSGVARLNADGSLDASFNHLSVGGSSFNGTVLDLKIQADGKVLIAGRFDYNSGSGVRRNLARLNSDGSADAAFNAAAATGANDTVWRVEESAGKIIVSGVVGLGFGNGFVNRLNADGSLDNTFAAVVAANTGGNGSTVAALRIQPDGKILIGGGFGSINGFAIQGIGRLNADGTIDPTFNTNGAGANGFVFDLELGAGGKIFVGGNLNSYNNTPRSSFVILNSDGSLDNSMAFNNDARQIRDLLILPDGKILIGGDIGGNNSYPAISRVNQNGTIDQTFTTLVGGPGRINRVLVQPDGKILAVGSFTNVDGQPRRNLVRLNADGTPDATFAAQTFSGNEMYSLDLRADGKILVGGDSTYRLSATGALETIAFTAFALDAKFLPGGGFVASTNRRLRKYTEAGSFISTFDVAADANIRRIVLQPDGKIIITGEFTTVAGVTRGRIARINADGTLDTTFNPPGGANATIFDAVLQPDGKIVVGGIFPAINFNTNYKHLARLNADGSLDTTFNPIVEGGVLSLKLQPDGKVLVGGAISSVGGVPRAGIARVNSDGSLDATFNPGAGANNWVYAIDSHPNGIVIGGTFTRVNNFDRLGIARLLNAPTTARTPFDFDGDGKADVSVFRPSAATWYVQQSQNGFAAYVYGASDDVLAPADFDGDGKTDLTLFRNGIWHLLRSTLGAATFPFGTAGDIPVPADYDGDGRADIAVFRPSNGTWYIQRSQLGFTGVAFGEATDKPAVGDYDADGKADIAVFRPSTGVWYLNRSTAGFAGAAFGQAGDLIVPADYDGDGKTDIAVYRSGIWYLNRSTAGFTGVAFGDAADKPTPADYDGDGKADIAVYRPSNGVWYLFRSTQGFTGLAFGVAEDKPIPNAYVR